MEQSVTATSQSSDVRLRDDGANAEQWKASQLEGAALTTVTMSHPLGQLSRVTNEAEFGAHHLNTKDGNGDPTIEYPATPGARFPEAALAGNATNAVTAIYQEAVKNASKYSAESRLFDVRLHNSVPTWITEQLMNPDTFSITLNPRDFINAVMACVRPGGMSHEAMEAQMDEIEAQKLGETTTPVFAQHAQKFRKHNQALARAKQARSEYDTMKQFMKSCNHHAVCVAAQKDYVTAPGSNKLETQSFEGLVKHMATYLASVPMTASEAGYAGAATKVTDAKYEALERRLEEAMRRLDARDKAAGGGGALAGPGRGGGRAGRGPGGRSNKRTAQNNFFCHYHKWNASHGGDSCREMNTFNPSAYTDAMRAAKNG